MLVNSGVVRFTNTVKGESIDVPAGYFIKIDRDGKMFGPTEADKPGIPEGETGTKESINPLIDVTIVSPSS